MSEKNRVFILMLIMAGACMVVVGITIAMLYNTAFQEEREVLVATAKSQARLIEAITRFDSSIRSDPPAWSEDATLNQIIEAQRQYEGIGKTGEFTLAKREGNNIVFLMSHRYYDFDTPKPVPLDSELAEPMRRALSGLSGTTVGKDYRGETVLAAYEPVAVANWGIVAKVDLAEIRAPFMKAGAVASVITIVVILFGSTLFVWISNPIMRRLSEHSQRLTRLVESLQLSEENLQKSRDSLEVQVNERAAELVSANSRLEIEVHQRTLAEERLQALWKAAEMVNTEGKELSDHILQGALRMTHSKYAFYGFMSPDESVMSIHSWSKDVFTECRMQEQPVEFPVSKAGMWAEAIRQRKVLVVNDYQAEQPGKRGSPAGHVPLSRILVVPVLSRGRIASLVAVANKAADYEDEDVRQLEAFVSGVQVIIDQRKTEKQLRESEKKYSALVENSLTGIYISLEGTIVFANNRFAEMHGYAREEVVGMKSWMFIHPEARAFLDEIREKRLRGEEVPLSYQIRGLKKDGEIIGTERSNVLIEYQGKPAVMGNVVDITQRQQMEEALRASEKECRLLSRQVIDAQEKERKRFAREIHDGIGQSLAAIKYRTEGFARLIKEENAEEAQELQSIIGMIQSSMTEVRKIQNDLRPANLDELGFLAAISGFCDKYQETYIGIKIDKRTDISEHDMPEYLKTPIFRIFQEALNNAAKHSRASRIGVFIQKNQDRIELAIEDNGVGFEMDHMRYASAYGRGLGLYSMRERAELSGGFLEIKSAPGKGTAIRATWQV
jgi:PAS domain S-box-containing protein